MNEITNVLAGESRANPEMPPSPIGEAAAFVARLLSESGQPAGIEAEPPASIVPPERPPEDRNSIPPGCPSILLTANQNEHAVPRRPSSGALLPYSKTAVAIILSVLAILLFGSGLAVGYAVLGGHSKAGSKSTVQGNEPPAARHTATSEAVDDQTSAPNAADDQPLSPTVELSDPAASTLTPGHAQVADKEHHADLQSLPAVAATSEQSEQAHAIAETPHMPAGSSALDKHSLSIQPFSAPSAPHATTPPVNTSSRHAPTDAPLTAESSAQTSHPERPTDSVRSENLLPAASAPRIPLAAALPAIIVGTSDRLLTQSQLGAPTQPPVTSLGHIEPSQLIHSEPPVYPQEAKKLHIEGDVQLRIVVAIDGTVRSVNLVSGPPLLAPAAMDAAREFRYKPAMLNGKPIETVQTIEMSFNLKN